MVDVIFDLLKGAIFMATAKPAAKKAVKKTVKPSKPAAKKAAAPKKKAVKKKASVKKLTDLKAGAVRTFTWVETGSSTFTVNERLADLLVKVKAGGLVETERVDIYSNSTAPLVFKAENVDHMFEQKRELAKVKPCSGGVQAQLSWVAN